MTTAREETTRLAELLRREHHALAEFLVALAAFDREKRWAEMGHASLFSFLRRELRLSAGAAQYRKTAAALVQEYPQVEAALRDGRLCLSTVIELAKVMTPENTAEILPRFFGLSARDAAFVATSIRPVEKPPVRGFLVTPLRLDVATETVSMDVPPAGVGATEAALVFRTSEAAPATMTAAVPVTSVAVWERSSVKPLDGERARVSMTVSRRLLEKLAAARDALSHSHPGASEEQILEVGLDLILQRHARRRGLVEKPRKTAPTESPDASAAVGSAGARWTPLAARARSRYVPAEIRRAVWVRDGGRCAWPLEGGGVCGSTHRVELDHVDGFALGGATSVERCRLLCRAHQDVHARELYGNAVMDRYSRPKGGCSEPVAAYGGGADCERSPPFRSGSRSGDARQSVEDEALEGIVRAQRQALPEVCGRTLRVARLQQGGGAVVVRKRVVRVAVDGLAEPLEGTGRLAELEVHARGR